MSRPLAEAGRSPAERDPSRLVQWHLYEQEPTGAALMSLLGPLLAAPPLLASAPSWLSVPLVLGTWVAGLTGFAAVLAAALPRRAVTVAKDGFAIRSWTGERFVHFDDVTALERETTRYGKLHHLARVVLRDGSRLRVGPALGYAATSIPLFERAFEELETRLAEHRARAPVETPPELHRERSVEEWIAALKAKRGPTSLREATLDRARLLAIAEDPRARPAARAAAAYLLRGSLAPTERERVRVAATESASTKVRVALETAADENATEQKAAEALRRAAL